MEYKTISHWDEELWQEVSLIYHQSFGPTEAKPDRIIRNMFRKQMCFLHVAYKEKEVIAIALSGKVRGGKTLLIDYLAVSKEMRSYGIGVEFLEELKRWAIKSNFDSLLIEVESEATPENLTRMRFWEKSGFMKTDYIHHYTWVPEPYKAMFLKLHPGSHIPTIGMDLFTYIEQFHKESYKIQ
jgi:GNAT superfamily N-acetyltransferase